VAAKSNAVCKLHVERFRSTQYVLSTQVSALKEQLSLDDEVLADAIGTAVRQIKRWLADENFPQRDHRLKLVELEELAARLEEVFANREGGQRWLHQDSPYLGQLKPAEALKAGRIDRVNAALESIASGFFV
jgi:Protein of unknown function (DUF2384)